MSISSSAELLMTCLPVEDAQEASLSLVHDLDSGGAPGTTTRHAKAQAAAAGSSGSSQQPTDLSRALSTPEPTTAHPQPALTPGSTSSSGTAKQPRLGGTSAAQASAQLQATSAWVAQVDAAGMTQQAAADSAGLDAPAYRAAMAAARAAQQQQEQQQQGQQQQQQLMEGGSALLLGRAASEQLYASAQQQQQQAAVAGSAGATSAGLARSHSTQQRSASLDLLSPTAAQSLFPTLSGPQADLLSLPRLATQGALSPEQYQLLINSSMDPSHLAAAAAAAAANNTPTAPADVQLDTAEALWQQVAASGADDQTLISLAVTLGLITADASGNMVLAREARRPSRTTASTTPAGATAAAAALRNPLMAGAAGLPGLYSGSILDAAAAAVAASPRVTGSGSDSAPLPRLPSALAGLLSVYGSMRLPTASTPGSATKPLGSPGPGPSKQHTLYKTELCRGWLEAGTCRYGSKCQFAHGPEELRPVPRHPKYKTEVCRSFTATGVCAYGPRCRFIHGTMSAPNAILDQPGSARLPEGLEGLEGVLGFEDFSPTQGLDSARRQVVSPNRGLLPSLGGPSMALRQAQGTGLTHSMLAAAAAATAHANSQLTAQDAAAMTRLGRLLSTPAAGTGGAGAIGAGGSNRTSLDSAMSMAMARNALLSQSGSQSDMRRSSMSDVPRSSLDSRGRTSIESSQSQLEQWQAGSGGDTPVAPFASPLKAPPGVMEMLPPHQPFMPGIPEGHALPSIPHPQEAQWPGRTSAPNLAGPGLPHGAAADFAQLSRLTGFSFQAPAINPQAMGAGNRQMLGDATAVAAQGGGRWFPSGQWWSLAGKPGMDAPLSLSSEQLHSGSGAVSTGSLQSAYSSGLYASSSAAATASHQQKAGSSEAAGSSGMAGPHGAHPGFVAPERGDCMLTGDVTLASMLGL